MDIKITPQKLAGKIPFVSGKSQGHRIIIAKALAALKDYSSNEIIGDIPIKTNVPDDILKTANAVKQFKEKSPVIDCGASGTTLRLLLPVFAALCNNSTFTMNEQLAKRPLTELILQLEEHGCKISRWANTITVSGRLNGGVFTLPGNISSQYISGLLFALPLTEEGGNIRLTTELSSAKYVQLTTDTLKEFGIKIEHIKDGNLDLFKIDGNQHYKTPKSLNLQRDWSATAFWLTATFAGSSLTLEKEYCKSIQPDIEIMDILQQMKTSDELMLDCDNIPDLVPVLTVAAAFRPKNSVTKLINLKRLHFKESDRVSTSAKMLTCLGGNITATDDSLTIISKGELLGGIVDGAEDHRIVMAAAIAATACSNPVIIKGAQAVSKSYPDFFKDFKELGGNIVEI